MRRRRYEELEDPVSSSDDNEVSDFGEWPKPVSGLDDVELNLATMTVTAPEKELVETRLRPAIRRFEKFLQRYVYQSQGYRQPRLIHDDGGNHVKVDAFLDNQFTRSVAVLQNLLRNYQEPDENYQPYEIRRSLDDFIGPYKTYDDMDDDADAVDLEMAIQEFQDAAENVESVIRRRIPEEAIEFLQAAEHQAHHTLWLLGRAHPDIVPLVGYEALQNLHYFHDDDDLEFLDRLGKSYQVLFKLGAQPVVTDDRDVQYSIMDEVVPGRWISPGLRSILMKVLRMRLPGNQFVSIEPDKLATVLKELTSDEKARQEILQQVLSNYPKQYLGQVIWNILPYRWRDDFTVEEMRAINNVMVSILSVFPDAMSTVYGTQQAENYKKIKEQLHRETIKKLARQFAQSYTHMDMNVAHYIFLLREVLALCANPERYAAELADWATEISRQTGRPKLQNQSDCDYIKSVLSNKT